MIEQTNALLNHDWTQDEKVLIKRLIESLLYYKYMMPKNLKADVISILEMANKIKHEYTTLQKKITLNENTTNLVKRRNSI